MDDEFNEQSFSKVEADSQDSVMIRGIDDIGYETEKDEDESPKENFTPHYNPMLKHLEKTQTCDFGNPFQSQSYLRRLLSDDSERDDGFFYPNN